MKPEHTVQLCELMARLVDAVESVARHAQADSLEFVRLHNIRHDALVLMTQVQKG